MPRRFYVIMVKGTDALGQEEAQRRGFTIIQMLPRSSDYATMVVATDRAQALGEWFLATTQAPFPDGELMHYKGVDGV